MELPCALKSSQSPNWINNCRFIYPVSTSKPNITKLSRFEFWFLSHLPPQQVSDILMHPDVDLGAASGVAVLKLRDKAKISQSVLPVCLPKGPAGEASAREAYSVRWIPPHRHGNLSRSIPTSHTERVQVGTVSQCEGQNAQGGEQNTAISNNMRCGISPPSGLQKLCPSLAPGFAAVPVRSSSRSDVSSGHDEQEISGVLWQLLQLEAFSYQGGNCNQIYAVPTQIANFRDWIVKNMK